jgi:DNA invertase Pin-like site-specific DNA recombinase
MERIFEDVASGNDRRAMMKREEFGAAVTEAKKGHGTIIVTSLDRVSRNSERFWQFLNAGNIRLKSIKPGEDQDIAAMRRAVGRGQRVRETIAAGTKRALAAKKQHGTVLGYSASLGDANRASRKARSIASHLKVLDIRDELLRHAELRSGTAAAVAAHMNAIGKLSGRNLLWTKHSIRRQLRSAKHELEFLEELDEGILEGA